MPAWAPVLGWDYGFQAVQLVDALEEKTGQPELRDFLESLALLETLPGICLDESAASSLASLAT
jgi:hypothetical protein